MPGVLVTPGIAVSGARRPAVACRKRRARRIHALQPPRPPTPTPSNPHALRPRPAAPPCGPALRPRPAARGPDGVDLGLVVPGLSVRRGICPHHNSKIGVVARQGGPGEADLGEIWPLWGPFGSKI
jgi:hypothetical protein